MYYKKDINGVVYIISGVVWAFPHVSSETDSGKLHFVLVKVTEKGIKDKMILLEK